MVERGLRLLVKARRGGRAGRLQLGPRSVDLELTPLMPSIERSAGVGMAGVAAASPTAWHIARAPAADINPWDACHALLNDGLGLDGGDVDMAEPDLEQEWQWRDTRQQMPGLATEDHCKAAPPNSNVYAVGNTDFWFSDESHSQLELARDSLVVPNGQRIRIAHLDTGYDDKHVTRPKHLRTDLARNFVDDARPNDATDEPTALINLTFGHGTGTLGILAGNMPGQRPIGGASELEIVPIRVANLVVLFRNSAIARAFDYVHSLWDDESKRVHVVTMSMGGVASAAWADAVNALYERGIFVVTAAGNCFDNKPTRYIVYPARFDRVIAACGVMADGRPYADLPINKMAGCYGPSRKNPTSMAGYTPNIPWAKIRCVDTVDLDGGGTSAATPQIAAAAALWLQKNKAQVDSYPESWMRIEAVRKALIDSARRPDARQRDRIGMGSLRANDALGQAPAAAGALRKTAPDTASLSLLRVLTGLGIGGVPTPADRMLELEMLQISQRSETVAAELEAFDAGNAQVAQARRLVQAMISHPGASMSLRRALGGGSAGAAVALTPGGTSGRPAQTAAQKEHALHPKMPVPVARRLWVYARDPLGSTDMHSYDLNEVELAVPWEENLQPGPVGEYLEVVDVDPPSGLAYMPVDLNHPHLLAQGGHKPTEGNPQFHQQMVYAVAMKTIGHFEKALGRRASWASRLVTVDGKTTSRFVQRLRIYPHALREANAYYSPEKRALLFGYFRAVADSGDNLPAGRVFNCLSHDIVAHETTHALLDGLHPRYKEPTRLDMLAFHEAFADIVALFQHFTMPESLRAAIREADGHAGLSKELAGLAVQFGQALGQHGALRDAIASEPKRSDYSTATEPHALGSVLVGAVFSAFRQVYDRKTEDLFRLATNGTGVLPKGRIPHDLVNRLAEEAAAVASSILDICIRALDYSPPVDLTFGEYLRALITADRDLEPDDKDGYRVAFISAFRDRGIFPEGVQTLSVDALTWQTPDFDTSALTKAITDMGIDWRRAPTRAKSFVKWNKIARGLHQRIVGSAPLSEDEFKALGLVRTDSARTMVIDGEPGTVSRIEIHSMRPARRVNRDGAIRSDIVIEMTQSWTPEGSGEPRPRHYRGGCTIVCDLDGGQVRYLIRKRVGNKARMATEREFRIGMVGEAAYFNDVGGHSEPFAMMHRDI